jgi:hypothetical protein
MIKSGRIRWEGLVASMEEDRSAYNISVGKPKGKKPPGRPRRRWEADVKIDLREIGWGGMDWIHLAQDRDYWMALMNMETNVQVQNFWEILWQLRDWMVVKKDAASWNYLVEYYYALECCRDNNRRLMSSEHAVYILQY